jgi:hypothetical protein
VGADRGDRDDPEGRGDQGALLRRVALQWDDLSRGDRWEWRGALAGSRGDPAQFRAASLNLVRQVESVVDSAEIQAVRLPHRAMTVARHRQAAMTA